MAKELFINKKNLNTKIENAFLPYILMVGLQNVEKEGSYVIGGEWIGVLEKDSLDCFDNLTTSRIQKMAKRVHDLTSETLRHASTVSTQRELVLAISLMINKLVREEMVDDVQSQGVLISNMILIENDEDNTWGALKAARVDANRMFDYLQTTELFTCKNLITV